MNTIFFKVLLTCGLFLSQIANEKAEATSLGLTIKSSSIEQKIGMIQQTYQFTRKVDHKTYAIRYYVLDDGFTLYSVDDKKKNFWKKGDILEIQDPFEEADEVEVFLTVKNITQGVKKNLLRMGWACPHCLKIMNKSLEIIDGDKIVTITLDDDTVWKFSYFDEHPYAKHWRKNERVMLLIDTHEANPQSPFLHRQDLPTFSYEIINLDSKYFFAGESAKPSP